MVLGWPHRLTYGLIEWLNDREYVRRDHIIWKADPLTALLLPDLGLPRLAPRARAAFRAVIRHEKPTGNGSVDDILRLIEARGYVVHPADWIPRPSGADYYFPPRYSIWSEWLAAWGYWHYTEVVPLTLKNARRFRRDDLQEALRHLYQKNRSAAYDLLLQLAETAPEQTRYLLLDTIGGGASFYGNYPSDVPILKQFANDPSEMVRDLARKRLRNMEGLETAEAHAEHIAWHLDVQADRIVASQPEYAKKVLLKNFACTTVEALASQLGLSPLDMIGRWDRDLFATDFWLLILRCDNVAIRSAYAERRLQDGQDVSPRLLRGVDPLLWEQGLRSTFKSQYMFTPFQFLGEKMGTMDATTMQELSAYKKMEASVLSEIEKGTLPVHNNWDPLRVLGLTVGKTAAAQVLREATALGMKEDNPRLLMLKLNLEL